MIIQCEKCQTRFRLEDSRVTDKGVKVRCTKCKNVFTVHKEESEIDSFEPEGPLAGFSFSDGQAEEPVVPPENQHYASKYVPDAPFDADAFEDGATHSEPVDFSSFETSTDDASAISFESDAFHGNVSENTPVTSEEPAGKGDVVDFSSFDFNDSESEPESNLRTTESVDSFGDRTIEPAFATPPKQESPQGLDFSDDAMFGAVVPTEPEPSSDTISFDFGEDSFAESMDMGGQDSSGKSGSLFSLDSPGDAPFNLGEIDFGDELTSVAVQQVNPDDLKPSQEILFAPLAEAKVKSMDDDLARSFLGDIPSDGQQELPPLSIVSRRKQSPLFSSLIAVIALLVLSIAGYFGYSSFSSHTETVALDTGKIGVSSVVASYLDNDEAGEILVISGDALNEYAEPRAALQVKVTIFDAQGQIIASKSAYGGNPLTEEQLESLPLEKIEAAMANQFGDSLANMEVAPGKAIPFVIVLADLPKGAKDFEVQPSGSTIATGKHP